MLAMLSSRLQRRDIHAGRPAAEDTNLYGSHAWTHAIGSTPEDVSVFKNGNVNVHRRCRQPLAPACRQPMSIVADHPKLS